MTIRYSRAVASGGQHFPFIRLLFRWHGSFYKLIVYEFTLYSLIFFLLNVIHSFVLTKEQERIVSEICAQLGGMSGYVVASVTFCLGFFIQQVYRRFCQHFDVIPWPDGLAFLVSVNVRGRDVRGRLLRRTIVRYAIASIIMTWMNFSERMTVLFPDLESLVVAGFLTENELTLLKSLAKPTWRQLVAASWCAAVIKRARMENRIQDDFGFNAILKELEVIRVKCSKLVSWSNRPVPLAYFHTVIIGVYAFFSVAAIGGSHRQQTQKLHKELTNRSDIWELQLLSQAITMLQFAICAGVLAISRSLLTPFGRDDGNIDPVDIVGRHLSLAYLIVDDLHSVIPEIKDTEAGRQVSIFHIDPSILKRMRRWTKKDVKENALAKRGYFLSVAPRKEKTTKGAKQSQEEVTMLSPERRSSDQLLVFQKLNNWRVSNKSV